MTSLVSDVLIKEGACLPLPDACFPLCLKASSRPNDGGQKH